MPSDQSNAVFWRDLGKSEKWDDVHSPSMCLKTKKGGNGCLRRKPEHDQRTSEEVCFHTF